MRSRRTFAIVLSAFLGGCFYPVPHEDDTAGDDTFDAEPESDAATGDCAGAFGEPPDLSTLEPCCQDRGGDAHCYPADKVPMEYHDKLSTCANGDYCVPDQFLVDGGRTPPEHCSAFDGPGRCLSKCLPDVDLSLFPKNCTGDQLCAPCTNPQTGESTGACDIGKNSMCMDPGMPMDPPDPPPCDDPATCTYDVGCPPYIDPATLNQCAPDAHCLGMSLLTDAPPDLVAGLAACADPTTLCVPDKYLVTGGKYIPQACTSLSGAEGRCQSRSVPSIARQEGQLPQDVCGANELCAPCYNPVDGSDTGACTTKCDPGPTQPAIVYAHCCDGRGSCAPKTLFSPDQLDVLDDEDCNDGIDGDPNICAESALMLGVTPMACSAHNWISGDYTGVCLTCMDWGLKGLAISGGTCPDNYDCAPCVNPDDGTPTGLPGCPP